MSDDDDDDEEGVDVVVPPLGVSVTEATIYSWVVRSGDHVTRDQPIVSLGLDKIDVELEAPASGVLVVRDAPETVVKIGDVIARVVPAPPVDHARESRHDELLAAVAAAPDDDGARQVYADFLLEAACPLHTWGAETTALRGEYLALVARLKRPHEGDDLQLLARRRAELEPCARATALSLVRAPGELQVQVEDGFVAGVHSDLATLVSSHERIFARAPIRSLAISNLGHDAAEQLLALPRLEQLRALTLVGESPDRTLPGDALARIVGTPRLAGLRRLELRTLALGPAEGAALASSPAQVLELRDCQARPALFDALGDRAFERLVITELRRWNPAEVRAAIARPLRELALSGSGVVPPLDLATLERLELAGFTLDPGWTAVLATATRLVRLELRACTFGDREHVLATIAALPPGVRTLVLQHARVGNLAITDFADTIRARTAADVVF